MDAGHEDRREQGTVDRNNNNNNNNNDDDDDGDDDDFNLGKQAFTKECPWQLQITKNK